MIVSTHKFMFHGIWHRTIFYAGLFFVILLHIADHVWFSLLFSSPKLFFLDFLSKLFVKTLNSTGNSWKIFSSKEFTDRLTGFTLVIYFPVSDFSDLDSDNNKNRSNFGEVDVGPAKTDEVNKVEKWQKLTAGLNPNHMHIFKPWKKRCAKFFA